MYEIRRVLQWFVSAQTLVDRPDRAEALKERASNASKYIADLDQALQGCYKVDLNPDIKKTLQNRLLQARADYRQCLEYYDEIIEKVRSLDLAGVPTGKSERSGPSVRTRLPDINLPKYSGGYESWMSFINVYGAFSDRYFTFSKLSYFLSCLSGDAHQVISHLTITDNNYECARTLLQMLT